MLAIDVTLVYLVDCFAGNLPFRFGLGLGHSGVTAFDLGLCISEHEIVKRAREAVNGERERTHGDHDDSQPSYQRQTVKQS